MRQIKNTTIKAIEESETIFFLHKGLPLLILMYTGKTLMLKFMDEDVDTFFETFDIVAKTFRSLLSWLLVAVSLSHITGVYGCGSASSDQHVKTPGRSASSWSLPTVLHVLRLVHSDGELDLQVVVRAGFGYLHLVHFRLLRAVGGWVQDNL